MFDVLFYHYRSSQRHQTSEGGENATYATSSSAIYEEINLDSPNSAEEEANTASSVHYLRNMSLSRTQPPTDSTYEQLDTSVMYDNADLESPNSAEVEENTSSSVHYLQNASLPRTQSPIDSAYEHLDTYTRLNLSSTWTAALYFYMTAYGLPVNEDEWGADICKNVTYFAIIYKEDSAAVRFLRTDTYI